MKTNDYSNLLKRIFLTYNDLRECKWCIDYLNKDQNKEQYSLIEKYLVIAYMRPFSGNDKYDLPPESRNKFNQEEIKMHEKMGNLRNKVIAHSSFEASKISITISLFKGIKGKREMALQNYTECIYLSKDLNVINNMCKKLHTFCLDKSEFLRNKLPVGEY